MDTENAHLYLRTRNFVSGYDIFCATAKECEDQEEDFLASNGFQENYTSRDSQIHIPISPSLYIHIVEDVISLREFVHIVRRSYLPLKPRT